MQTTAAQRLQVLLREITAAASGKGPSELYQKAVPAGLARLYLRRCTHVGLFTRVYGRPRVVNDGTFIVGNRVRIWSTIVRSEFVVFPGGILEIGDSTSINYGTSIGATGSVRIGRDCLLGPYTMILDNDFHEIEDRNAMPAPRPVVLEDNVWLGNRTLILPGVTVGHDSVIGAGSVVIADIPPRCVALGNPARVIKRF